MEEVWASLLAGLGTFQQRQCGLGCPGKAAGAETKVSAQWWENKYAFPTFPKEAQTNAVSITFQRCFQPDLLQLPLEKTSGKTKRPFLEGRWSNTLSNRVCSTGVIEGALLGAAATPNSSF